tara:strand:- start:244 stop:828 length:585 start_codon:yes stop_codon:yes gene_type:complete
MKKNQRRTQLALISLGLLLFILTYLYYPNIKRSSEEQLVKEKIEVTEQDGETTTFENMEYKGLYDFDKPFIVKSEKAYILSENPNLVYMTNMSVILYLTDGREVNIVSDKGRYDKVTYDCFFEENVKATDGTTTIFSENLDLLATENVAEVYNDVNLENPTGSLAADKINYDFETKNFKVSMFGNKKIKMKVVR